MSYWRDRLRPPSFRGVRFHLEVSERSSGRRIALHEFPKRDTPYAEDMGRAAQKWAIKAYLVGEFYTIERDELIAALEAEGPGQLVHPTIGETSVVVGEYTWQESREHGGYCEFDILFIEAGTVAGAASIEATEIIVGRAAVAAAITIERSLNNLLRKFVAP